MKALNNYVFIERYQIEREYLGLHVSEKACVKNHIGVIRFCEDKSFLGKEVHVPHYQVEDVLVDGTEYAMCKMDRIFAVREVGEESWEPVNGYVKVRKCVNDHVRDESGKIALYMTDNHIEFTEWVRIIDIDKKCSSMKESYIGKFCIAPESDEKLARLGYSKDYMLQEDLIEFLVDGD